MKTSQILVWCLLLFIVFTGCKKKTNPDPGTTFPQILSLSSDKDSIKVGGTEPAILTCIAAGGNISYIWEVDLGDIFPLNATGNVVRFTGSECCVGEKYIKCTVWNDKGSVTDTVTIYIYLP